MLFRKLPSIGAAFSLAALLSSAHPAQAQSYTFKTLESFSGGNEFSPLGALTNVKGTLYGLAGSGGANSYSMIYSYTPGSGISDLADFSSANGGTPNPQLAAIGDTLYGTNQKSGSNTPGKIFSYTIGSSTISDIANGNGSNGIFLSGGLINSGGVLYGTSLYGGSAAGYGDGTIFSYTPDAPSVVTLASFTGTNGSGPRNLLVALNNTFYGTTFNGGSNGDGTIFSYTPGTNGSSGSLNDVYNFTGGANGQSPAVRLTNVGGVLYGTTPSVRGSISTLFSYTPGTGSAPGTLTTLHTFTGLDGTGSFTGLLNVGGVLYGTTSSGGSSKDGTIYSYVTAKNSFTTIYSFTGGANGANPDAGLTNLNGVFYGTTDNGGNTANSSTIFSLTPNASPAPEPSGLAMLALTTGGLGFLLLKARKQKEA